MSYTYEERINFIDKVQRRPLLYDADHQMYRDKGETLKAWKEVAKECNINSVDEAKKLWNTLRTSYVTHVKSPDKKKCKFVNELSFLTSRNCRNIEEADTINNEILITPKTKEYNNEDNFEDSKAQFENDRMDSQTASSSNFITSNNNTNFVAATCSYGPDNDQDDLTHFFNSICLTARRLPYNAQQDIKLELLQVMNRAVKQNDS